MGLRTDYQRIGDLVGLCGQTMRMMSAEKREQGTACPFKPLTFQLEELAREIKSIAERLPAHWDDEAGADLHS